MDKREDFNECVVYIKVFEGGRCELLCGRSGRYTLYVPQLSFKVALGVSPQFFYIWIRVLNHNRYVEIKQFPKEDIKQNDISTVILLIKYLVYQWDPCHLQGSRVVYIFIYTLYEFVFYLISNHIFVYINHVRIHVNLIICDVHKELSSLRMKNSNRKYKERTGLFTSWINRWGRILIRYSIHI